MTAHALSRRVFYVGDLIFQEGEIGERAYIVERGGVEIFRSFGGREHRIGIIPPGGIFGEMALLDGAPRMASARALDETVCQVIPREVLTEKLRKADPFIAALLRVLLATARSAAAVAEAKH